jgi:hypothetical protein
MRNFAVHFPLKQGVMSHRVVCSCSCGVHESAPLAMM